MCPDVKIWACSDVKICLLGVAGAIFTGENGGVAGGDEDGEGVRRSNLSDNMRAVVS